MKVILYMAMTANGIIARENSEEDFLSKINWDTFLELAKENGCFIVGRRTYEAVKAWKDYNFDDVDAEMKIVVSKRPEFAVGKGYTLAKSPKDAIAKAASAGFDNVILTGGASLNSAFAKEKLIDEIMLNIEPAILGKGISLFAEDSFEDRLELIEVKQLKEGIVQLHYKVKR